MWIVCGFTFSVVFGILSMLALVSIVCLLQKLFNLSDKTTEHILWALGIVFVLIGFIAGYIYGLSYLV